VNTIFLVTGQKIISKPIASSSLLLILVTTATTASYASSWCLNLKPHASQKHPKLRQPIMVSVHRLRWLIYSFESLWFFFCHRKCCFIAKESSLITLVRCEHACCFCFITLFISLFHCTVVVAIPWYVSSPCSCCFSLHYCYWIMWHYFSFDYNCCFASSHYQWCCLIALVVASCTCCYIAKSFLSFFASSI
jgi:hypothetical protein